MNMPRWQLAITTDDPSRTAAFWRSALGYVPQPPPDGYHSWGAYAAANGLDLTHGVDIDAAIHPIGTAPRVVFVRDDRTSRGKVSIEILVGDANPTLVDAHARRLVADGARISSTSDTGGNRWIQLRSPDGDPFRIQ
jgi:catechol 2,3-dioxygenase-like lactoylglutathione lyase family enzyme